MAEIVRSPAPEDKTRTAQPERERGRERDPCITLPVSAGVAAATVRPRFVDDAAASRSWSSTIAITHAGRVGTSICESS